MKEYRDALIIDDPWVQPPNSAMDELRRRAIEPEHFTGNRASRRRQAAKARKENKWPSL